MILPRIFKVAESKTPEPALLTLKVVDGLTFVHALRAQLHGAGAASGATRWAS